MQIAVVGADAPALCRASRVGAAAFPALRAAAGGTWDVLALTRDAAEAPYDGGVTARIALLPGDGAAALAAGVRALQAVSYGLSSRDTLTLSSLAERERLLCLQRSVLTVDGALLEPQELPLPADLAALTDEQALLAAGLRLLCGTLGSA